MITKEELALLKEYIKAVVAEEIEKAFGRDSLHEYIRVADAEDALDKMSSEWAKGE